MLTFLSLTSSAWAVAYCKINLAQIIQNVCVDNVKYHNIFLLNLFKFYQRYLLCSRSKLSKFHKILVSSSIYNFHTSMEFIKWHPANFQWLKQKLCMALVEYHVRRKRMECHKIVIYGNYRKCNEHTVDTNAMCNCTFRGKKTYF